MSKRIDNSSNLFPEEFKTYGMKISREQGNEFIDYDTIRRMTIIERKNLSTLGIGIPSKVANALEKLGIMYVGDLLKISAVEVKRQRNMGEIAVGTIYECLVKSGLKDLWDYNIYYGDS